MEYNNQVNFVFDEYFVSVAKYCTDKFGIDNKLPLSNVRFDPSPSTATAIDDINAVSTQIKELCQPRSICSRFAALSCHGDDKLYSESNLISNIREEVSCL